MGMGYIENTYESLDAELFIHLNVIINGLPVHPVF